MESVDEAFQITTMSHLIRTGVMLEVSSVDVIVRWVTVDETGQKKGVEGKAPTFWRRMEVGLVLLTLVVERVDCCCVLLEIVLNVRRIVSVGTRQQSL